MDNIEIANEIARLEAMCKHYKILYRKLIFCCYVDVVLMK